MENKDLDQEKKSIKLERDKMDLERRMLDEQSRLFEQKLAILKDAYLQLDKDRKKVEWEKLKLKAEKQQEKTSFREGTASSGTDASVFFRGADNQLALKKRYRDLIKIFHTDNLYGDKETLQAINREYERLSKRYDAPWRHTSG